MSSPSSSASPDVAITNKTAFPLNIAFRTVAPLQHTNALEPGDAWATHAPPLFPIPPELASVSFSARMLRPVLRVLTAAPIMPNLQSKWLARLRMYPQVEIDIRFDHEHNRFSESQSLHIWTGFVLRWTSLLALCAAALCIFEALFIRYTAIKLLVPMATYAGSLAWMFGLSSAIFYALSHREYLLARATTDATQTEGKILTAIVPLHTLHPRPSASPPVVASSLSPGAITTAPPSPLSPHAHRNLAVTWTRGRFALWDTDLDQEIPAFFVARR